LTGKSHASFFKYVGYGKPFPTEWVKLIKSVGAVPHIAWEPNDGLERVKDDDYLHRFAQAANDADVPIFLRYASEMNGNWTEYSGKAELYKEKWRLIHRVMSKKAPNVVMVWTVFPFPKRTIEHFYPGDRYVDWVGVNIYNVVYHNNDLKQPAQHEDPLQLMDYVYNKFSHSKPIQVSEFGVSHFSSTDGKYRIEFAKSKLSRMYGSLSERYPRVKSIFYFDVNNLLNAPVGRQINNYAITYTPLVLQHYKRLVNQPHFLSSMQNHEGRTVRETFSFRQFVFERGGILYVDAQFFQDYLGLTLVRNSLGMRLEKGGLSMVTEVVHRTGPVVEGLPIRKTAQFFCYDVDFDQMKRAIRLTEREVLKRAE
jgi:hypothetical protein